MRLTSQLARTGRGDINLKREEGGKCRNNKMMHSHTSTQTGCNTSPRYKRCCMIPMPKHMPKHKSTNTKLQEKSQMGYFTEESALSNEKYSTRYMTCRGCQSAQVNCVQHSLEGYATRNRFQKQMRTSNSYKNEDIVLDRKMKRVRTGPGAGALMLFCLCVCVCGRRRQRGNRKESTTLISS